VQGAVVVVETRLRTKSLYLAISAGGEEFLRESFAVASPWVIFGLFPGKSRLEAVITLRLGHTYY
jgi:hypothetical protein